MSKLIAVLPREHRGSCSGSAAAAVAAAATASAAAAAAPAPPLSAAATVSLIYCQSVLTQIQSLHLHATSSELAYKCLNSGAFRKSQGGKQKSTFYKETCGRRRNQLLFVLLLLQFALIPFCWPAICIRYAKKQKKRKKKTLMVFLYLT